MVLSAVDGRPATPGGQHLSAAVRLAGAGAEVAVLVPPTPATAELISVQRPKRLLGNWLRHV